MERNLVNLEWCRSSLTSPLSWVDRREMTPSKSGSGGTEDEADDDVVGTGCCCWDEDAVVVMDVVVYVLKDGGGMDVAVVPFEGGGGYLGVVLTTPTKESGTSTGSSRCSMDILVTLDVLGPASPNALLLSDISSNSISFSFVSKIRESWAISRGVMLTSLAICCRCSRALVPITKASINEDSGAV